ncbi:hypothetical protein VKT23_004641 [Stygiomarasmius scandens]|uniref:Uncharacterized protein n=1 Tax=Marasmiellus scandens TaxID=2682957 RepID=A0ABR1JWK4_9AGAR
MSSPFTTIATQASAIEPTTDQYRAINTLVECLITGPVFLLYYRLLGDSSEHAAEREALLTYCQRSVQRAISNGTVPEIPPTITMGNLRPLIDQCQTLVESQVGVVFSDHKLSNVSTSQDIAIEEFGSCFVKVSHHSAQNTVDSRSESDNEPTSSEHHEENDGEAKVPVYYQQRDTSSGLAPKRAPWNDGQANARRIAHKLNPELYEELGKNVGRGPGLSRWNKTMDLMQTIMSEREWNRYHDIAEKINSGQLESVNVDRTTLLKRAARYLDGSILTLDLKFDVQALVLLSWKNEHGRPTIGVQHTSDFLCHMKGYERFREHVTRLFIDLLESEDGDIRLGDEDLDGNRDPPKLPQPCPNNKKDLVKLMTKYLSDVAKWQGGFKTKRSVPWSKLGSLPQGTLLTTESVPSHVNLGQTNIVQGDAWVDWYEHILQRENNGHIPAICWTAEALKKPFERGATTTVFQSAGLGPDDDENDDWSRELDKLQPFPDDKDENLDVPMGDSSQASVPTDQPVIDPHLQDPQASEQFPHHQSAFGLDSVMGTESQSSLVPNTHPSSPPRSDHVPLIPESRRSLMGRKDKPGRPVKSNASSVARGSNKKKSGARKRDAQEARGEATSVVEPSKRT